MDDAFLMEYGTLARATGGELLLFPGAGRGFTSVYIDSREVRPGSLFVALPGTSTDGHRFVEAAFRAGAACAMVARSRLEDSSLALEAGARKARASLLVVEDTLAGLQDAARVYLEGFPGLLRIGCTGSAGKSTTKEIAAAMIGREKQVIMNRGNLNSETGLPLSVFEVRAHHEVGIFEMGMNKPGEIAALARVLNPQIALITMIGTAHIEFFGNREAILDEKMQIFSRFSGTETALIPEDDDFREAMAAGVRGRVVFYGPKNLEELKKIENFGLDGTEITWEGISVRFRLPGRHNLRNALAAAAIARAVPVSSQAIREGLAAVKPLFGRSEIIRGPVTVIRDCYNANPESTAEAIGFCDSLDWPGRRVYVIGSMLELGTASGVAHAGIGRLLAASKADMAFLFGPETRASADILAAAEAPAEGGSESAVGESGTGGNGTGRKIPWFHTDTMGELSRALGAYIRPGDLVLLKGSRGCALEQVMGTVSAAGTADVKAAEGVV
ncbi:MAG: UDP-N-acetylmuramoyl-tripeptide--D-alanyl-D-alanine ligase [Treponema sp.]|jgi:UDP-N-acetylmuramoyl-tripeptide--D-alanyl-D-alanine ligase|nr:UDP-N-acetylmuramoyl-tripeptide--D-alanyl-D-alanine ligase [Treponema sp.]